MTAEFIPVNEVQFRVGRLHRHLELSQAALLDIRLDVSNCRRGSSSILFKHLGTVNAQRWRSLKLRSNTIWSSSPPVCIAGFFSGSFTALQSLFWEDSRRKDCFQPIYDLMALSSPVIKMICTKVAVPASLLSSAALGKVVDLTIPTRFYTKAYQSMPIEIVHLTSSYGIDFSLLPPLPKGVKFDAVSSNSLTLLNLDAVQSLEILYYVSGGSCSISFPSLVSLILPKTIRHVSNFAAPSLVSLRLGHDDLWGKLKQKESECVIKLFTEDRDRLSMSPTSLHMDLSITAEATITVLSRWVQIQYLSLDITFGERFVWQSDFSEALTMAPNFMCPNLVTLKLRTRWDKDESNKWQQTAKEIFRARHLCPLERISWVYFPSKRENWMVLLREDVDTFM